MYSVLGQVWWPWMTLCTIGSVAHRQYRASGKMFWGSEKSWKSPRIFSKQENGSRVLRSGFWVHCSVVMLSYLLVLGAVSLASVCSLVLYLVLSVNLLPVSRPHNLISAKAQWCSLAGKVTADLVESNGSLPPGLWLQGSSLPGKLGIIVDGQWKMMCIVRVAWLFFSEKNENTHSQHVITEWWRKEVGVGEEEPTKDYVQLVLARQMGQLMMPNTG